MAWSVSETFRRNCYDDSKKQRMTFVSEDGVVLTNEDISAENSVKFNLTSIKSDQIMFGETNGNTISLTILNDDRRIQASDIYPKEFKCYIGVEVANDAYNVAVNAISAVHTDRESISVHSVAPYIRGNIRLGNVLPQLEHGWNCKIMLAYDRLYFVVRNNGNTYYAKHVRISDYEFGNYTTPSSLEIANLDRLMNDSSLSGISLYETGFEEFIYDSQYTGSTTWGNLKNITWGNVKNEIWGFYSGYTSFSRIKYEVIPYGIWHFDRPRRINSAVLTLNGKDRMSRFDIDSKEFMQQLASTYGAVSAISMLRKIAEYRNVPTDVILPAGKHRLNTLVRSELIYNLSYQQNKSLKDLLSYLFEVGASNGIIDRDGTLCGLSCETEAVQLPYVYSFDVADCVAHTIGKALVYRKGDYDLYQTDNTVTDGATYEWSDNPFFVLSNPSTSWFSNGLHKKYGGFHNAITVCDCDYSIWVDDVYSWEEDGVTYVEPIFSMSVEWNGFGRVTYTNSGTEAREYTKYSNRIESVSSINDQNLQGFNQAQYEDKLEFGANGLTVHSRGLTVQNYEGQNVLYADENGDLIITGRLSAATGSFSGTVEADSGRIGNWDIVDDNLKCVSDTDSNNYIVMGKNRGYPTMMLCEPIGISSAGETIYKGDVRASGMYFAEVTGDTSVSAAFLSYGRSSRGRTLSIQGNNFTDGLGACDIRIISQAAAMLIAPVITFSTSPYISTATTTTSSANTALVSGSYGRQICLVSSLRKNKDNIKTIENASEKVDNLRGVSFTSKCEADDPNVTYYGFIAEEVEKAVPELAAYEDGKLQSVQYDRVCALLVEDNKACHRRIEELERRLEELERRLSK